MLKNLICTPFELKQFAFSLSGDNPTVDNFTRFIESKSRFKYTIVEVGFLRDVFETLEEHTKTSAALNKSLKERWKNINIPMTK